MALLRESLAVFLALTLSAMTVWSAPGVSFGTVMVAQRAHVGTASVSAGATVFDGDKLSTEPAGSLQIRAGAARLVLGESSSATIAQVWIVNSKQLIVRSTRGALTITVNGETQIIPEAMAYRVVLDPQARPEQEVPHGAGTKDYGEPPHKADRNHFYLVPIIVTGAVTAWAVHEAWESPDKP